MSEFGPNKLPFCFESNPTIWVKCNRCGFYLYSHENYISYFNYDQKFSRKWTELVNETHLELCEGDPYKTLVKVEQIYKEYISKPKDSKYDKRTI